MLENELFAFLEGTTDAAFSVNEQGEILSWNVAAQRLFGYSSSEVLSRDRNNLHFSLQALSKRFHRIHQKLRTHNSLEAVMDAMQRKLL